MMPGFPKRIASKIQPEPNSGCWLWTAGWDNDGYGKLWFDGRGIKAHNAVWKLTLGEIPKGRVLDHLCRVRCCCNPQHMEPVTIQINGNRGTGPQAVNHAKQHCVHGHPFNKENTYLVKGGRRQCRACNLRRVLAYQRRRKS